MVDTLTAVERSVRMARIKSTNSRPEMMVRRLTHGMGFRFRLHVRNLPGVPDLVFPKRRKIIFVHGCFWHRHGATECRLARLPKSRLDFWLPKLESNRLRDEKNLESLKTGGWDVLQVWECEMKDQNALKARLRYFLEDGIS